MAGLGRVLAVSRFVSTAPVGYTQQPDFLNGALLLETGLLPGELLRAMLAIEQAMGRDRSAAAPPKGPRLIDLDLLIYDDLVLAAPGLTLPHPEMHQRAFVLGPLAEIAPEWLHPGLRVSVRELLRRVGGNEAQARTEENSLWE